MVDGVINHRIALPHEERRVQVDADQSPAVCNLGELLVGQVARVAAQNPRIAVRCNKRTVGCLAHIPEAAVGQMRYINDYPLLAAVADQLLAQLGQTLVLIHGG